MTTTGSTAHWTFSYRTRHQTCITDSESGSDAGHEPDGDSKTAARADTSDARLMREMDLSGRHETVEYRPNPWSIARINAVTRSSLPKSATGRSSGPSRPPLKPQLKPIVEAFQKQAQREPRVDQQTPLVIDNYVSNGPPRVDKPTCATTGEKSHQGNLRDRTLAPGQPRVGPGRAPLVDPHSTHQNLQSKSAVRVVETLEKGKLAHISPSSDVLTESVRVPTLVKPRRMNAIHGGTRSSPLRCAAPQSPSDIGNRFGPTFRHSSPGGPSHVLGSARAMLRLPPVPTPLCATSLVSNAHRSASPVPPFHVNGRQETAPKFPLDARDEATDTSPPSIPLLLTVPNARQHAGNPPHIRTPDPPRRCLASPDPTRAPKKSRVSALQPATRPLAQMPTSQRRPSAYAFGEDDDPDAEWSTLARSKRSTRRAPKSSKMKQSGPFRLPILGPARTAPVRVPEAQRRVITYMPPPMAGKNLKRVDAGSGSRASATDRTSDPTRGQTNDDMDGQDEDDIEMRVMDSDMTLVNEDADADGTVAVIDLDDVRKRYPMTRASMKAASFLQRAMHCIVEVRL